MKGQKEAYKFGETSLASFPPSTPHTPAPKLHARRSQAVAAGLWYQEAVGSLRSLHGSSSETEGPLETAEPDKDAIMVKWGDGGP